MRTAMVDALRAVRAKLSSAQPHANQTRKEQTSLEKIKLIS
jgi:hypothetical protein